MLDWKAIRVALRNARLAQRRPDGEQWSLQDLSEMSGVDKATLHRIENLEKLPKYRPDVDTIFQILFATTGQTLSEFFAQFERDAVTAEDRRHAVASGPDPRRREAEDLESRVRANVDVVQLAIQLETVIERLERLADAQAQERSAGRDRFAPNRHL
jgi:transcriptional regulator with XRE-family HTH domain